MDGHYELKEAKNVADEGDDGVKNLEDYHSFFDILGEAEAVKDVDSFVIDVIEQVILEVVP